MRIIGGAQKGRALKLLGRRARPTQGRIRGAIFNILQHRIKNASVLDLFSGSGAIGLEALSRGARNVTFVDSDVRSLIKNVTRLGVSNARILKGDIFQRIRRLPAGAFDLIFLDPPYNLNMVNAAVISVVDLLSKSGIITVEHHKKEALIIPTGFYLLAERRYGDTMVSFLGRRETGVSG